MRPGKTYHGLVFDCDGTLADTMPAHYVAWHTTMQRHGITFTEDRFYALGGVPSERIVAMLAGEAGLMLDAVAVAHEKELAYVEFLHEIKPVDRVITIARDHRGRLPMAVATGSARWLAEKSLTQIGVLDWFDALACSDDVANHKPAPDVFLEAARRIKIDPRDCCAYEDTDLGIAAAKAAGMDVVDVRTFEIH